MAASETLWPAAVSERSAALLHGPPPSRHRPRLPSPPPSTSQVGGPRRRPPGRDARRPAAADGPRVATTLPTVGWGAQPGDEVVVGGGEVRLPGVTVRGRPHAGARARRRPRADGTCDLRSASPLACPAAALARHRPDADRRAAGRATSAPLPDRVGTLVGAGPGLTPSGDDVLCGVLLGLRLHPRGSARAGGPAVGRGATPPRHRRRASRPRCSPRRRRGMPWRRVVRLAEALAARGPARATRRRSPPASAAATAVAAAVGRCSRSATARVPTCSAGWPAASTPLEAARRPCHAAAPAGLPEPGHDPKEPTVTDHVEVRSGAYYDSVSLMQVSRAVAERAGRRRGAGRDGHRAQPRGDRAAWGSTVPDGVAPNDLVVAIRGRRRRRRRERAGGARHRPGRPAAAGSPVRRLRRRPGAPHPAAGGRRGRRPPSRWSRCPASTPPPRPSTRSTRGVSVMVFSDNVPVEDEVRAQGRRGRARRAGHGPRLRHRRRRRGRARLRQRRAAAAPSASSRPRAPAPSR